MVIHILPLDICCGVTACFETKTAPNGDTIGRRFQITGGNSTMIRSNIFEKLTKKLYNNLFQLKPVKAVYWLSFPKCGRTWLRLMLGSIFVEHYRLNVEDPMDLEGVADQIPHFSRFIVTHDGDPHTKLPEDLPTSKQQYRDSKVILLVRDPRDVLTSLYFQRKYREHLHKSTTAITIPNETSVGDFLKLRQGGLETIIEYYNIWDQNKNIVERFMLLRYEDLHENTFEQLQRVFHFLDIQGIPNELVHAKIEYCSFDNMQAMERLNNMNSFRLRPGNLENEESFKTRKGKVGGYKEYFDEVQIHYMNQMIANKLHPIFGY